MYSGEGVGLCDARFFVVRQDGTYKSVDWLRTLGYAHPQDAPRSLRRLEGCAEAWAIGDSLRRRLGPSVDLRIDARLSTPYGWEPVWSKAPLPPATNSP